MPGRTGPPIGQRPRCTIGPMTDASSSAPLMTGLMKKAKGAENVGLGSVPRPVRRPGQVLIEVYATGICGTDLHIQQDEYVSHPPVVMGHEVTGRVVEAGAGAEEHLGKRVAPETYFYTCDICAACRAGTPEPLPVASLHRLARERRLRALRAGARPATSTRSIPASASTPARSTSRSPA